VTIAPDQDCVAHAARSLYVMKILWRGWHSALTLIVLTKCYCLLLAQQEHSVKGAGSHGEAAHALRKPRHLADGRVAPEHQDAAVVLHTNGMVESCSGSHVARALRRLQDLPLPVAAAAKGHKGPIIAQQQRLMPSGGHGSACCT